MEAKMTTGLPVFDRTVQETNLWLEDLEDKLGASRHQAYAGLRATLHALRDRLPPETALHFAAQLPMLLRGVFTEGWTFAPRPDLESSAEAFVLDVGDEFAPDFPFDPETIVRATFQTIRAHMDLGGVDKIVRCLSPGITELWLEDVV
jgi:uncharacterized protein (DUF2267 family)